MKISIIGTGYVGLISGICLSEIGHSVICVDNNLKKIENIKKGNLPFFEKGANEILLKNLKSSSFQITSKLNIAVTETNITIITVGTPSATDGSIDLSIVEFVTKNIAKIIAKKKEYHLVVLKSTSVPGTTENVILKILSDLIDHDNYGVCMNPEFLREGNAVSDFMYPDRVIIGTDSDYAFNLYSKVYEKFSCPILKTNFRTAEMIKYTANSLLSLLISFSNEIATISELIGDIDILKVMEGVCLDERFMPSIHKKEKFLHQRVIPGVISFLKPGCGFGGSCFPKDVKALISISEKYKYKPSLLKGIISVNEIQPIRLMKRLEKILGDLQKKKIVIWGLSFKPETDDIRMTPAYSVIHYLLGKNAHVHAHDPIAIDNAKKDLFSESVVTYNHDKYEALLDADVLIVLTSWNEYKNPNFDIIKKQMKKNAVIVDGRLIYSKKMVMDLDFKYLAIGYNFIL